MSVESLQPSLILREYKRVLTENYKVSKDARDSITLSTNIFIHYITTLALESARKEKKSTIQPKHILNALEISGFDAMLPELETLLNDLMHQPNLQKEDTPESE